MIECGANYTYIDAIAASKLRVTLLSTARAAQLKRAYFVCRALSDECSMIAPLRIKSIYATNTRPLLDIHSISGPTDFNEAVSEGAFISIAPGAWCCGARLAWWGVHSGRAGGE